MSGLQWLDSIVQRVNGVMDHDELHYRILKLLETQPHLSQREVATALGISLGKVNYCLRALITRGLLKAKNFRNSGNKLAYAYLLTPRGIEEKSQITVRFLRRKMEEYERFREEIDLLRGKAGMSGCTEIQGPLKA